MMEYKYDYLCSTNTIILIGKSNIPTYYLLNLLPFYYFISLRVLGNSPCLLSRVGVVVWAPIVKYRYVPDMCENTLSI